MREAILHYAADQNIFRNRLQNGLVHDIRNAFANTNNLRLEKLVGGVKPGDHYSLSNVSIVWEGIVQYAAVWEGIVQYAADQHISRNLSHTTSRYTECVVVPIL